MSPYEGKDIAVVVVGHIVVAEAVFQGVLVPHLHTDGGWVDPPSNRHCAKGELVEVETNHDHKHTKIARIALVTYIVSGLNIISLPRYWSSILIVLLLTRSWHIRRWWRFRWTTRIHGWCLLLWCYRRLSD